MVSFSLFSNILSEPPSHPTLRLDKCLRRRLNTNRCKRCVARCPSGALSESNREIHLDETQCTGCMSCVAECPQEALVSAFDMEGLLLSSQKEENIVISCVNQTQRHPGEIPVPCVGLFSKQVLTALLFSDYRSIVFNVAGCAECCNRKATHSFFADCAQLDDIFSGISQAKIILAHKDEQANTPIADRRSYLKKVRKLTTDVTRKYFSSDYSARIEEKKTHRVPYKTRLIKNLVLNVDKESSEKISTLFGHSLSINQKCDCCPLCKGICPTGAIKRESFQGKKKLKFNMLKCTGCGLCVEFCKKGALSLKTTSKP